MLVNTRVNQDIDRLFEDIEFQTTDMIYSTKLSSSYDDTPEGISIYMRIFLNENLNVKEYIAVTWRYFEVTN